MYISTPVPFNSKLVPYNKLVCEHCCFTYLVGDEASMDTAEADAPGDDPPPGDEAPPGAATDVTKVSTTAKVMLVAQHISCTKKKKKKRRRKKL